MPQSVTIATAVLALVLLTGVGHALTLRILRWRGVTVTRTKFGPAFIFDTTDEDGTPVRMLNVNGAFQSACYATDELCSELACEYQREEALVVSELPRLRTAAIIGGGGFTFPKWLATNLAPVRVTAVEIDPKIIELARERFYLGLVEERLAGTGRLLVACADGWEWLRAQEAPFDLIMNEAFTGSRPLGPLGTAEGAKLVHEHLSADGSYMANVRCSLAGRDSHVLEETLTVFASEFAHVWLMPEFGDEPRRKGNNTFVASDCDLVAAGCTPLAGREWRG